MPTVDEQVQANIRAVTGTQGMWVEDWHALFDLSAIPRGQFNERLIAYYLTFNSGQGNVTASSVLNAFLLNPSTVTNGSILSLFAAGEQGGWYDPSDFSTLFQDSAGTTPVTATGQSVGRMLDKSGRANHVIQATAGSRPVLQQDASGKFYLSCDGIDDSMATVGSVDFTATSKMTICAGLRKLSDAALGSFLEHSATVANNGTFAIQAPTSAAANYGFAGKGTLLVNRTATTFPSPITNVLSVQYDLTGSGGFNIQPRVNAQTPTMTADSSLGGGTFMNAQMFFFRRAGASLPFNGRFYGAIVRGAASNASQISMMEAYMNAKTGAF